MISAEISFSYRDGTEIFRNFAFTIPDNSNLLIIADPGKGKTTLAKILTGAVPEYSGGKLEGSVVICGTDILPLSSAERLPLIGRVSQNSDEMLLFSSIEEEIAFPLANLGLPENEIASRTEYALGLFGLSHLRQVPAAELSGGEKRRLMLAVLFAIDPAVYVLDESFDELSPEWRRKLAELVMASEKPFIILGSHELAEYREIKGERITIENTVSSMYSRKPLPSFSYEEKLSDHVLAVTDVNVRRRHRSLSDEEGFMLSIPSFSLRQGECIVLTGENGTGKSSFSRVLCGILEESRGDVLLDGRKLCAKERRKSVAYLMQNPYEELFLPTVLDEAKSTGAPDSDILRALELFRLDPGWYTAEISYGRAKLLQAMVFFLLKRPFAILDEFDSSLTYDESLGVVRAYLEAGAGIVVITHDMDFASLLPGRHMHIESGVLS